MNEFGEYALAGLLDSLLRGEISDNPFEYMAFCGPHFEESKWRIYGEQSPKELILRPSTTIRLCLWPHSGHRGLRELHNRGTDQFTIQVNLLANKITLGGPTIEAAYNKGKQEASQQGYDSYEGDVAWVVITEALGEIREQLKTQSV